MSQNELVAVTGSTGYVGGRLVPRLLESGYRVRCVTRSPDSLTNRPWSDDVEIVVADLQDPVETFEALNGADYAFYLVHSMSAERNFAAVASSPVDSAPRYANSQRHSNTILAAESC